MSEAIHRTVLEKYQPVSCLRSRQMLGNNQKEKKKSFLKALPQLSFFKTNEKASTVGKKEKHFSLTKRSEKEQLRAAGKG